VTYRLPLLTHIGVHHTFAILLIILIVTHINQIFHVMTDTKIRCSM